MVRRKVHLWLLFLPFLSLAQRSGFKDHFSHDVGVFLGGSYYIGDLNPRNHFLLSQPAFGGFYRFNYNERLAFRGGFNYGSVMGDDTQSENLDQLERNLNFRSRIYEIYAQTEFNFVEYRIGTKYKFSPYIYLGVAGFKFKPMASLNNNWYALRDLTTEGQKTTQNPTQKPYRLFQLSVPFGIGMMMSVSKRIGIGFEWGPRKTFTDYIDDVSNLYVDPYVLAAEKGSLAAILSNRSTSTDALSANVGKQRGNPFTKDWYFYYGFTLNIQLRQAPKECRGF